MQLIINTIIVFSTIITLTFMQKYHFKMIYYIKNNSHWLLWKLIWFFIRVWVIIHEILHMIFWIIWWSKIKEIRLFDRTWWKVIFETKNYIWAIWDNYNKSWFFMYLFFNQIWIFLTSIWPLIWGIIFNYIFINFVFWLQINYSDFSYTTNFLYNIYISFGFFILYFLLLPSFILSFQDISNFIVSKQDSKIATFAGSIINTIIFICFILFLTLFTSSLLYFLLFYCIIFTIIFSIFSIFYIFRKFFK